MKTLKVIGCYRGNRRVFIRREEKEREEKMDALSKMRSENVDGIEKKLEKIGW